MAIYLKANNGNVALKTSGVPQSQINDLLDAQKEKLEAEYGVQIDTLNTTVAGLKAENAELIEDVEELQAIVAEYPTPVKGVKF